MVAIAPSGSYSRCGVSRRHACVEPVEGFRITIKNRPRGPVRSVVPDFAAYSARIQFTSRRALPSVMATALGGMERPLTLPFQWLL